VGYKKIAYFTAVDGVRRLESAIHYHPLFVEQQAGQPIRSEIGGLFLF